MNQDYVDTVRLLLAIARKLPLEPAFTSEFVGMTREEVGLAALEQTQDRLMTHLPGALTASHRDFLLSLVSAEPAWELMPFKHLSQLPALQWKLLLPRASPA